MSLQEDATGSSILWPPNRVGVADTCTAYCMYGTVGDVTQMASIVEYQIGRCADILQKANEYQLQDGGRRLVAKRQPEEV